MSEKVQPVETIGQKREKEISARWAQKRLAGMAEETASAGEIAELMRDGYDLGIMGIGLDRPADVAEKNIAEYKATHQTPTQS